MELSLRDLIDGAARQYRDLQETLEKESEVVEIRHGLNATAIPPDMVGRAFPVNLNIASEKIEHAKALLIDPQGLDLKVYPFGTSARVTAAAATVRQALLGIFQYFDRRAARSPIEMVVEDVLLFSQGGWLIMPDPRVWASRFREPDLEDVDDLDEQQRRVRAAADHNLAVRQQYLPILCRWVSARNFVVEEAEDGSVDAVWIFEEHPVQQVLRTWVDDQGRPRARGLAELVELNQLTALDRVFLVTRVDHHHLQVAVSPMRMWQQPDAEFAMRQHGQEEIVWQGPHGLDGRVPFAYFPGRQTTGQARAVRFNGLLDPVLSAARAMDDLATQMVSTARSVAWAGLKEVVDKDAVDAIEGEKPQPFEYREGGIHTLAPGHDVQPMKWTSPDDMALITRAAELLDKAISMNTFTAASYGAPGVNSGYLQDQLTAATQAVLNPFARGLRYGFATACSLFLACARAILDRVGGVLPILYVGEDGQEWVTLKPEHLTVDWLIEVDITPRPFGQTAAIVRTNTERIQAGRLSIQTAMESEGIRNVERELRLIMRDAVARSPQLQQIIVQLAQEKLQPALSRLARTPDQLTVPQALAQNFTNPELLARLAPPPATLGGLPDFAGPQPGEPGPPLPGLPNSAAQNPAPPPPAMTARKEAGLMQRVAGPIPGLPHAPGAGVAPERRR